jgi:Flp pilus assembly pilin Flp
MLLNDAGASAAEYALILALVGMGIVVSMSALRDAVVAAMTDTAAVINQRP